jgi:DNA repair exonuclease SbcCD ATPase subunit
MRPVNNITIWLRGGSAMSQPDAPHQCPRCGSRDCSNPDDKACSDNCITRLHAEVATLREQEKAAHNLLDDAAPIEVNHHRLTLVERIQEVYDTHDLVDDKLQTAEARLAAQAEALERLEQEMTEALSVGAFFNPEQGIVRQDRQNALLLWRDRLAALRTKVSR